MTCLRGASAIERALRRASSADIRVFVIWEPVIATDWRRPGGALTSAVADPRAAHFWDPRRQLSAAYGGPPRLDFLSETRDIGFRMRDVIWDAALVYAPGARWGAPARWLVAPVFHHDSELEAALRPSAPVRAVAR